MARDLTAPWTFRRGAEPEELWLRITTGLAPGAMPSYSEGLTPDQRWDIVGYLAVHRARRRRRARFARDLPQRVLVLAQWIVLALGAFAFIFGGPRPGSIVKANEEDVRALIAYLRTPPKVGRTIPPPRPPSPDDCDIYTFYLRGPFTSDCRR